jgi:dipeptidyl-peptidase-4
MKQALTFLVAALIGCALFAQNSVIDTRPAHDGKDLTMEEAIFQGVGYARAAAAWMNNDFYVVQTPDGVFQGRVGIPFQRTPYVAERRERTRYNMGKAGFGIRTEGNSIYGFKDGNEFPLAVSEDRNIVYGQTVSRNEFGINAGYYWSPMGNLLAFYRKDESKVTDFPLLDIQNRTGELRLIKYPMNGMDSEIVSVGIYDFRTGKTVYLQVTDFTEERFITNISWSPDEKYVFAQVLDRSQHHCRLNQYRAGDGSFVRTLLTEDNEAWVEPQDPLHFLKGRTDLFLYRTDNRDGYKNLYLVDTLGQIRRLTAVNADVEYLDNNGADVYYTSAEISPVENHLFKISVSLASKGGLRKARFGKPVQLTQGRGWHSVSLNEDLSWFTDTRSNLNTPLDITVCSTDGKQSFPVISLSDPLSAYASCQVELGTVPSADGQYQNYYRLIYPKDFDPSKKYPVVLYVYGGPHSQLVQDSWLGQIRMWEMLMAQKGYLVYIQDNRGTPNRGAAYEKAINRRCGQEEMKDQMVGINWLRSLPYVDAERIGVHGWSYGGFMTISLMTTYPDVFKVGVAGGPVIDWKWYEIMYGERYMDNPETNPEGFQETSLVEHADRLKGKLLICQGAVDNTVVWEHSLSFIQACIDREIPVDYFPYPIAEHNVRGRNRIHLMDKVTQYFEDYL